ncbi:Methyltransferase type 11 [Methanothermus fervidus DSM 2088]|uniref:Methyltransferase type 11 n=1 Tax=Methanothermus fervidus (strain ATCC 43054 / DSM 2088 / JCM 10308 / V24 S) TaxID=523846 RepID=E3GXX5_METFV|nr:class I SAM-dependent methyltransferase [Methanothermus fervidus]ADP77157.1 Methyltransferase type 11 [Methanothermus fervidus DSM 2088]
MTTKKIIYQKLALDILEISKINEGICIDVGTGNGFLAIELAKHSNLKVFAIDISPKMIDIAKKHVAKKKLLKKVIVKHADVHRMPFPTNFADLVVSRGSMFFWENRTKAFNEIYRVLKPGGFAYIGGGYGSAVHLINFKHKIHKHKRIKVNDLIFELDSSIIPKYKITNDETGLWVQFKKNK